MGIPQIHLLMIICLNYTEIGICVKVWHIVALCFTPWFAAPQRGIAGAACGLPRQVACIRYTRAALPTSVRAADTQKRVPTTTLVRRTHPTTTTTLVRRTHPTTTTTLVRRTHPTTTTTLVRRTHPTATTTTLVRRTHPTATTTTTLVRRTHPTATTTTTLVRRTGA